MFITFDFSVDWNALFSTSRKQIVCKPSKKPALSPLNTPQNTAARELLQKHTEKLVGITAWRFWVRCWNCCHLRPSAASRTSHLASQACAIDTRYPTIPSSLGEGMGCHGCGCTATKRYHPILQLLCAKETPYNAFWVLITAITESIFSKWTSRTGSTFKTA